MLSRQRLTVVATFWMPYRSRERSSPERRWSGWRRKRPLGTVVASAVDGFRALARALVDLAKLEVSEAASVRGRGVGMIGAAVVMAMYALGFVAAAGAAALALVLPVWHSAQRAD